ncbi:hypothetical protein HK097_002364 [Rhizophlyctis rosea]|uniref:FAS1 domain-containing protein n=1 Tax=Rhizophlyctis rosea TaxID=64517 RepID=A0AAD5S3F7_9FUNG|nr:hypothetical protein HK097_002364 [Rhizophlyctis rosea]
MRFIRLVSAASLVLPVLGFVVPREQDSLHISTENRDAFFSFNLRIGDDDHKHPKHPPKHPKDPKDPHPPPHPHPPHNDKPGDGDAGKTILEVISNDEAFSKLWSFVKERETLVKALNSSDADLTLFAPVDSAFWEHGGGHGKHRPPPPPEIITQGLLYHVVDHQHKEEDLKNGQLLDTGLTLGSLGDKPQKIRVFEHKHHVALNLRSHIIKDDIKASNGIIQAIDHILMPPPDLFHVTVRFPKIFGLLALAVKRAGLEEYLKETKTITLFAPTNWAFKKLGVKKLKYLFSHKGKEELKKILSYHVSTELVYGPEILEAKNKQLPTAEGHHLNVTVKDKDPEHGHKHQVIEINDQAHAFITDGIAANGVLHAIDHVLSVPKDEDGEGDDDDEEDVMEAVLEYLMDEEDDEGYDFAW